ncbi:MAG TPA: (Fe-S)-binding protein [Saccharospirillum sp.]|nr:(Fe-S)-binding protein [Saccharospirillum sp.]
MLTDWLLPILLFGALALMLIGATRRVMAWRAGRNEPVAVVAGLLAMPRRYLVDLHHVVERDRFMANTHVATAGGFVAALALALLVHGFGVDSSILNGLILLSAAGMFVGACCVAWRRRNPPSRLSRGPWMRLPKSLLVFSTSLFLITLMTADWFPAGLVGWVFSGLLLIGLALGLTEMLVGMGWGGPMKHAFAGALHLAFHRRPQRFGGGRSTGLKPLNLTDSTLGVAKPTDFAWNQLLGFDACVQCGRCEAVCPAFAAGQPLNPKKLIQDMVVGLSGGTDAGYHGSAYPGKSVGEAKGNPGQVIVDGLVSAETLWSCTTCRACVEECPMMIEHVDAIVDMRRFLTQERGATPGAGVQVLDNLIATDNPGGLDPARRFDWATDLELPLIADVGKADVLFWISDGAFDQRSQRILRAFVAVMRAANVDFAVLGNDECDSGDVARRLGDDATFQRLARHNIELLSRYEFNRIVTTDPHAFHVLANEYGDFGGHYRVQHHSMFINELMEQGQLNLQPKALGRVTYHDPCYLGRYNGEYESPRSVLSTLGIEVQEMTRSGYRSRCCGGGGGAPITDIPGEHRIADMRVDDARAVEAETIAVACQQCTAMLEGVVEPRPQIKDLAELVSEALVTEERA